MADFRVPVSNEKYDKAELEVELDWDASAGRWFRSEREWGLGRQWSERLEPTPDDLRALGKFFEVDLEKIPHGELIKLNPGALTERHREQAETPIVLALLCASCSKHWIVLKWNSSVEQWQAYGRTCDFSWRRAEPPQGTELELIAFARRAQGEAV